jgi:polysaccharide export outer membrane protein
MSHHSHIRRRRLVFVLPAISCFLGSCAGSGLTRRTYALAPAPLDSLSAPPAPRPFSLAAGDMLAIQFPFRPELSQELLVRSDGVVTLPLVGPVPAAGRTPEEVEADARRLYARHAYNPQRAAANARQYRIEVDDELSVKFRHAPELNATVRVRPDGRISLAMVKSVVAEGLTPEDLEAALTSRYAQFLERPELVVILDKAATVRTASLGGGANMLRDVDSASISLRSMAPRQVFVAGEVRAAGFVTHQTSLTVLQAIVAAGGPLRTAKLDNVAVLRKGGATPTVTFVNLADDVRGGTLNDFALEPFDIVIVPKTRIARVNDFLDQYLYQLVPASRNVNFTYFYDLSGRARP